MTAPVTPAIPAPPGRVRPPWPAWFGFAALGMAIVIAALAGAVLIVLLKSAGAEVDAKSPGVVIGATIIQDIALVATALWLAAQVARPEPWQFGLRGTRFWRGVKWAAIPFVGYFLFQLVYSLAVHPEEQTTLKDLGAGSSALATITIGILVVGVAPVVEEFFFRGFFFGALRTRFSFLPAAIIDGVVFGVAHALTGPQAIPPLIVLAIAFCVTYEATGSIIPGVILHSLNNTLAFGVDKDGSWAVGVIVLAVLMAGCAIVFSNRATPHPAPG